MAELFIDFDFRITGNFVVCTDVLHFGNKNINNKMLSRQLFACSVMSLRRLNSFELSTPTVGETMHSLVLRN